MPSGGQTIRCSLVGVDLGDKAPFLSRLQDDLGLRGGEDPRLAEHVAELGQTGLRYGGDSLLAQQADIGLPVFLILRGHGMGPQKGGNDVHGMVFAQTADDPELFELVVHIEAVAALGFHGGDAQGEHLVQGFFGLVVELVLGGLTGGVHRGEDAAAHGQDVQIGSAVELQPQLVLPPAPEDEMGVGVHQAGRDQPSLSVDDLLPLLHRRPAGADLDDDPVLHAYKGVLQHPDLALVSPPAGGFPLRGGQHADVLDQ